jgi:segregation and condensation protein A
MPYQVKLPAFEGPLDLLLHLIRSQEIDIYDIPIALITAEYLAYLELMKVMNLDVAGEWLVMAATLTYIKSRMLLPRPPEDDEDEGDEGDPRQELVEKLLEYQRVKSLASDLRERELVQREVFGRPQTDAPEGDELLLDVALSDLLAAYAAVIERFPDKEAHGIVIEEMSVTEMIHIIVERLAGRGHLAFEEVFQGAASRAEVVVGFLALLEMLRFKLIKVQQLHRFGPIRVSMAVAEVDPSWSLPSTS